MFDYARQTIATRWRFDAIVAEAVLKVATNIGAATVEWTNEMDFILMNDANPW